MELWNIMRGCGCLTRALPAPTGALARVAWRGALAAADAFEIHARRHISARTHGIAIGGALLAHAEG